jgi:hypothetical protein
MPEQAGQALRIDPAQLERVSNWATPLYWQAEATLGGARTGKMKPAGTQSGATASAESAAASDAPPATAVFVAVTPCRLVDTRAAQGFSGAFGAPSMVANTARTFPVPSSSCGVPAAAAYSLNFTVVPPAGATVGFVTAWPDDQTQPNTAVLTDTIPGAIVGNSVIVPAGADGGINVLTQLATDLVIDVSGYFAPPDSLPFGGTAAAPALTFGNTTTGLYSTGAGSLSIATNGVNALTVGPTGNLDLAGSITKGGTLFIHNLGNGNFAGGLGALAVNTGQYNTAVGEFALQANTGAIANTAIGYQALNGNTTGVQNTAVGTQALLDNTTGGANVATGWAALSGNKTGVGNTATGALSLGLNTTGSNNTGTGTYALYENGGNNNTAVGSGVLWANTGENNTAIGAGAFSAGLRNGVPTSMSGSNNTAAGANSLTSNTTGSNNVAAGENVLYVNTTGGNNTGLGFSALYNGNGANNTAQGYMAGYNATTGSYNVFIANQGTAADTNLIRIGDSNQTATFISGIRGTTTGQANAIPVVIDSNGQLGTLSSSRNLKSDIRDMRDTTDTIMNLRPVEFRYTSQGPAATVQYGLIAEEVAEVAPELAVRKPNGDVETVYYDKVNAMMLKQVQVQQRTIEAQAAALRRLEERLAAVEGDRRN